MELAPKHAEAHTALALYHAEIIGKIGAMIGGLTYGAKASEAESHIKTALKLTPDSPIAHVEHANVCCCSTARNRKTPRRPPSKKRRRPSQGRDGNPRRGVRPRQIE
jgi:hypothetical protein